MKKRKTKKSKSKQNPKTKKFVDEILRAKRNLANRNYSIPTPQQFSSFMINPKTHPMAIQPFLLAQAGPKYKQDPSYLVEAKGKIKTKCGGKQEFEAKGFAQNIEWDFGCNDPMYEYVAQALAEAEAKYQADLMLDLFVDSVSCDGDCKPKPGKRTYVINTFTSSTHSSGTDFFCYYDAESTVIAKQTVECK